MKTELIIGLLLTILPLTELRLGLPIVLDYVIKNNLPIIPYFLIVLTLNLIIIFALFFFMDFIHKHLLKIKTYKRIVDKQLKKIQKKATKFQKRFDAIGFLALTLFVAIPLPITGAYTGTLLAWMLNLERKKSIIAISAGVTIAGIIILLTTLGIFSIIN